MIGKRRTRAHGPPLGLGDFIRDRRDDILAEWLDEIRAMPVASALDRPALVDHLPDVLDRIAAMADSLARGEPPKPPRHEADLHAAIRLEEGFDLPQVVSEFTVLRDCITRLWQQAVVDPTHVEELRVVNLAIDKAVTASVDRFTRARDRTLMALDRIASEALESRNLDDLLQRLLKVFVEFTAAVDTAAILIRDGDALRVRAARGLDREREIGLVMKIGEGFAGRVAATAKPIAIAATDGASFIKSTILRSGTVRALYGVPLIDGGGLVGVAHMASLTANEFSTQDKHLLAAMANRASSAIYQHVLRETAEKTSAELEAILESMPAAVFIGSERVVTRANRAGLDLLGYQDAQQLARVPVDLVEALDLRDAGTGGSLDAANGPVHAAARGVRYQRDLVAHDHASGKDVTVHAVAAPIVRGGDVLGAVAVAVDVTARRRMEEALRERELEFRTLAESIPQLVWIADATGSAYWYNQRWYDYTGTTPAELAGDGWQRVQRPDQVHRVAARFRDAIARQEAWEDVFPVRREDGIYRWFLARAVPVRDDAGQLVRWFGTHTDVTEQRFLSNASNLLAASLDLAATLEQLAELAVPDLADMCVVDLLRGDAIERVAVAHADPGTVQRVMEWSRREPPKLDGADGIGEVIRTGRAALYPEPAEARLVAFDDELRELEVSSLIIAPLVARGRTSGAITLIRARPGHRYERSDLETAIELGNRAGGAFDNARLYRDAQDATRAREEILAIVSHDLRNPLATIDLGATLALESDDLGPKARKAIESIHRSATGMAHLVRDLLDATSIQAGRLVLDKSVEDAAALIANARDAHAELAAKSGIALVDVCDLRGARICGDRERLMQAFGNLVGNALKFCSRGDSVTIRAELQGAAIRFSVEDTGPGIADDELPHVFDPYWSAKRHAHKGTGLGLYICQAIVAAHGGQLAVTSKLGHGTTFSMTFPVLEPTPAC
jgi:PAS domain S-box-containing protein|nr:ATP-binding protein [Kofleriaceae bacterium]